MVEFAGVLRDQLSHHFKVACLAHFKAADSGRS
jgi:hypothetical protein